MYKYSVSQWLLFFYLYCFLGWCFESTYVSLKKKRWVNRGFLNGPLLPIYGSGAIAVLFTTLPFEKMPVMVYIIGLVTATALEYVVGVAMEQLFKVRYWDYSGKRFNIQGHICLSSSIAWGFFSVALVDGLHRPFESLVLKLPMVLADVCATVITVAAAADCMASLKTALDIRDLILQAEKLRTELNHMKRRVEIIDTVFKAELESRTEELLEKLEEKMESRLGMEINLKERLTDSMENLENRVEELRGRFMDSYEAVHMKAPVEELEKIRTSLEVWHDRMRRQFSNDKRRMLLRNPGARYLKGPQLLEELKEKIMEVPVKKTFFKPDEGRKRKGKNDEKK